MATVLVVDDEDANRHIARTLLGYRGHDVIEANCASTAITLARTRHPDVVVTDVLMPDGDGYELVRELRGDADQAAARTPVVFYTANYHECEARPIAEACGVSEVVPRGADPRLLLDAVDTALRNGPVDALPPSPEAFTRQHVNTVNAKLVEKVGALSDSRELLRTVAECAPVGIVLTDATGAATYVNSYLAEILAAPSEDLLGSGWLEFFPAGLRDQVLEAAQRPPGANPRPVRLPRVRVTRRDGARRWLHPQLRPLRRGQGGSIGLVAIVDDVTRLVEVEQRQLAEERRRQDEARERVGQRLDSLTRLAGGVAHDFNHILAAVLSHLDVVTRSITRAAEDGKLDRVLAQHILANLDGCTQGGRRAGRLTHQLLAFSRRDLAQARVFDVNELIDDLVIPLTDALGANVDLVLNPVAAPRRVHADPDKLALALRNLAANAAEAMPDGGTLAITTDEVTVRAGAQSATQLAPGRYVRISVADTGEGMAPEIAERAVEPFFTTRSSGEHAGLGLATAYGIVAQSSGTLTVTSTLGQGTTVDIHLPAFGKPPPSRGGGKPAGRRKTILVVDGRDDSRHLAVRILTRAGYRALPAADGPGALAIAEQHDGPVHCLLTDIATPGLLGTELASRLTKRRPGLAVLFMSDFAALLNDPGLLGRNVRLLTKPFTAVSLLDSVHSALNTVVTAES